MERNTQTQRKNRSSDTSQKTERGSQHVGQQAADESKNARSGKNVNQPVRKGSSAPTEKEGEGRDNLEMDLQDTPTELADLGYGDGPARTKIQPNEEDAA